MMLPNVSNQRPATSGTTKRAGNRAGPTAAGTAHSAKVILAQAVQKQGLQPDQTDAHNSSPPQLQNAQRNSSKRMTSTLSPVAPQNERPASRGSVERPVSRGSVRPRTVAGHARASVAPDAPAALSVTAPAALNVTAPSTAMPNAGSRPVPSGQSRASAAAVSPGALNVTELSNAMQSAGSRPAPSGHARTSAATALPGGLSFTELSTPISNAGSRRPSRASEFPIQKQDAGNGLIDDDFTQFLEQAVPSVEHRQEVFTCAQSFLAAVRHATTSAGVDRDMLADVLGPVLWKAVGSCGAKSSDEAPALESSRAEASEEQIVRFDFYQKIYQGLVMQGNTIMRLTPGNALEKKGVREKWRLLAVDSMPIRDHEELCTAVDLRRKFQNRAFKVSFEADVKTAAIHREKQRAYLWRTLHALRPQDKVDLFSLEQNREAVLHDRDATLALISQNRVHELEVLLGRASASEIEQLEELLAFIGVDDAAEVRRMVSHRLVTLRDRDGLIPAHHVQSALCAEIVLQAGPPHLAREVSADGQTVATMVAARGVNIDKVLMSMDLPSVLAIDSCGMSVAMRLEHDQWEHFSSMLPTWEEWLEALPQCGEIDINQVIDALARIQKKLVSHGLVTDSEGSNDGVITALHLACFGELAVWRDGKHTERSSERLRRVGSTVKGLFGMLNSNPSAVSPLKIFMSATKGPKHGDLDPRAPWRNELDDAVAAYEQTTRTKLDELAKIAENEEAGWLLSEEDTMLVTGPLLRLDAKLQGCPSWQHPKWIGVCDFEAAAKDLGAEAIQTVLELGSADSTISGLERYEATFARLHSFSRREFCQQHVGDVRDFFVKIASDHGCSLHARKSAKAISRILVKAAAAVKELKAMGVQPHKDELKTAGDFVVDINGVEIIASDVSSLHRFCEWCKSASWNKDDAQILRLKNSFISPFSSGYRDIKVWMLVNIAKTPLVVEVQLLLDSLYQLKEAMHVAYEYRRGSFDHTLAEFTGATALQRMMRAIDPKHPELCTADEWNEKLPTRIDELRALLDAEKEALAAQGVRQEQELQDIAAGDELLDLLQSRKGARDELSSALEEGSDGGRQVANQPVLSTAQERSFSAIGAYERLRQARGNATASGLELSLDGFDVRSESIMSQLLPQAHREVDFELGHATNLRDFDAAVNKALLFETYANKDFKPQRAPFLKKAQDATEQLMASVTDEGLMRKFLEDSGDPNTVDSRGRTPLQLAVQQFLPKSTHTLIEFKADLNMTFKFGNTLLHRVLETQATTDALQVASELISGRADLNCANDDGWCPLHVAARQQEDLAGVGEAAYVELLVKTKKVRMNTALPKTEAKLPGASPLHVAVSRGNLEAVTLLVHGKADLNSLDAQRRTPLSLFINFQHDSSCASFLVKMQADFASQDVDGNSALHLSAAAGAVPLVQLFLDANADVNLRNKTRQTPLKYSQDKGAKGNKDYKEVYKLLHQNGGR